MTCNLDLALITPPLPLSALSPFLSFLLFSMDIDMSLDDLAAANKKPTNPRPTGSRTNSGPRRSNGGDAAPRSQAPYSVRHQIILLVGACRVDLVMKAV